MKPGHLMFRSDFPFGSVAEGESSGVEMITMLIHAEQPLLSALHFALFFLREHDKDDSVRLGEPSVSFRYGHVTYGGIWRYNNRDDVRLYAQIELPDEQVWTTPLYPVADFFLLMQEV